MLYIYYQYEHNPKGIIQNSFNINLDAPLKVNFFQKKEVLDELTFFKKEGVETNHLGNVLEVITDRKLAIDWNTYDEFGDFVSAVPDGVVDYYVADVVSQSDYYPFGMLMANTNFTINPVTGLEEVLELDASYRYSFQGQEMDNEIKGDNNSVNYKFRMHDPRVGRFFAVDPLTAKYPHYTPYSFSGNKVIAFVELEGLEELHYSGYFAAIGLDGEGTVDLSVERYSGIKSNIENVLGVTLNHDDIITVEGSSFTFSSSAMSTTTYSNYEVNVQGVQFDIENVEKKELAIMAGGVEFTAGLQVGLDFHIGGLGAGLGAGVFVCEIASLDFGVDGSEGLYKEDNDVTETKVGDVTLFEIYGTAGVVHGSYAVSSSVDWNSRTVLPDVDWNNITQTLSVGIFDFSAEYSVGSDADTNGETNTQESTTSYFVGSEVGFGGALGVGVSVSSKTGYQKTITTTITKSDGSDDTD